MVPGVSSWVGTGVGFAATAITDATPCHSRFGMHVHWAATTANQAWRFSYWHQTQGCETKARLRDNIHRLACGSFSLNFPPWMDQSTLSTAINQEKIPKPASVHPAPSLETK